MRTMTDVLDEALQRLRVGETPAGIMADYPGDAETLRSLLHTAAAMEEIRPVEMPGRDAMAADRRAFLADVAALPEQPVSPGLLVRLKGWMARLIPLPLTNRTFREQEATGMGLLARATAILILLFATVGGTAVAATDSLPGSTLYPLKLGMEEARLALTADPAGDVALHMAFAQERINEMERMATQGAVPDDAIVNRLRLHLETALELAAQMPDEAMFRVLQQVHETVQTQEQVMAHVQDGSAAEQAQAALKQAAAVLNRVHEEVQVGLEDPPTFRWRHTTNRPADAPPQPEISPPGPPITHTQPITPVMPGPGYGPGEPGGNPECPDGEGCLPAGDQHQYGPQPDQPGPGAPGGNPDCPDCDPAGDQHHYGQDGGAGSVGSGGNAETPGDGIPEGKDNHHGTTNGSNGGGGGNGNTGGNGGG